jgi:hypothetical protein
MNLTPILTLVGMLAAAPALAGEWQTLVSNDKETVQVQRDSIREEDGEVLVKVLRDYRTTQLNLLNDEWVAHRSKIVVYSVDCEAQRLGYLEWNLYGGNGGKGRTVSHGQVGGVVDFAAVKGNAADLAVVTLACGVVLAQRAGQQLLAEVNR